MSVFVNGQILINEFSASNSNTIEDQEFNDYSDWIELYNADSKIWNLKHFYLTDNFNTPNKWQIMDDIILEPGNSLLIWADGRNTGLHTNFKISAAGEELALYSPGSRLIDSISFGPQKSDVSYGRSFNNSSVWGYYKEPTPGAANLSTLFSGIIHNIPTFSLKGGFYNESQTVEITALIDADIRYTTDGSAPGLNATLYTNPVSFDRTTIIRARIFIDEMIPGPPITQSYFIHENSVDKKLPLVSIATDPANFWDPETGIYTQDFKPPWEIPVNIELFENNGMDRAAFNKMAGIKVNGLYSWQLPQKMLGVYFKKAYGPGNLDYMITPQRNRTSYKSFALRASGSDWSHTLFRDILGQHATLLNMDLEIMGFKPTVVYVNGEYLGIHNIREKVDADFIEKSFMLEPGSFDLIENQSYPEAGDLNAYNHLIDLLSNNLSDDANYEAVADLVDIENFTDLVITEMAVRNTSINHNIMAWKPKTNGKWRWVVMDLDRGFFDAGSKLISFYLSQNQLILNDLFKNQGYKEYFAGRLASQLFTTFNAQRMKVLTDEHAAAIESEIPRHIARWKGTTSSYGSAIPSMAYWQANVCKIKSFVEERPALLLADLQNFGFGGIANLSLALFPHEAGIIQINGLKTAAPFTNGPFLQDMDILLETKSKPGYAFNGWYELFQNWIINPGSSWRYLDTGVSPLSSWTQYEYNDDSWKNGPAELGYGDGDEKTILSYGGNESNKFITTYFRKKFNLTRKQILDGEFLIYLLKDDGAIVYLNGNELFRTNIRCGNTSNNTLAESSVSGEAEDIFISYSIDKTLMHTGINQLAVEIHQVSPASSDISFDLGLACYSSDNDSLLSTNQNITINISGNSFFQARYVANSNCMVPDIIADEITLSEDCSPYIVNDDITILESGILNIDPGVVILMPKDGNIFVNGILNVNGNETSRITIKQHPDYQHESWGGIIFRNTPGHSSLNYLTIEDASGGPDPIVENAAISAFNADLFINNIIIKKIRSNPIMARYSDVSLINSDLHSEVSGDLINVKYGHATIKNCKFTGNDKPDTDAIDFDEITNGIIQNCTISGFYGFNSDAVDIGEGAKNILIDSLFVFNITDKGVSLGQSSSATISNSVFINCDMGVGVKDSSRVSILNTVFYSNGNAVACFEKNIGLAGGNALVQNSILSNSSDATYFSDSESKIEITYSLSDNLPLPADYSNIEANPLFTNPTFFNFDLASESLGILSGTIDGEAVDIGTRLTSNDFEPEVMISQIYINASNSLFPEFIALYNPAGRRIDISGYSITKGVTASIPEGVSIAPHGLVFITKNSNDYLWNEVKSPVIEWTSGKLSDNGESIQLEENHGIVIDYLKYDINDSWPGEGFTGEYVFMLLDPDLDNHFPENWTSGSINDAIILSSSLHSGKGVFHVYPNPTTGKVVIMNSSATETIQIYDITGHLLDCLQYNESGTISVDLSKYGSGLFLLKMGAEIKKIIVME